ncbi:MAG TPA: serine/threonine-protein kinase [Polyangiaceae bacterium]|jgi:serine/threonine-protein kinase|nr:serine/threonine-protein kinase [Polyangiaceae bacterium]
MFPDFTPGTVLAGKFRVERVLGQGNMGVVLLATHLQLDQLVALKFLLPSALSQAELEARFAQEARAAAKIKSEHVARVIDVSALDDGAPYIVMEYLEGTDLAKLLARRGPLPVAQAVSHVLQACEALAEAHAAGIVHRDLKLSNLFVASYPDGAPCIKILDFGISKYSIPGSDPDLSMTDTAAVMGSPLYMSPEQMRSTRNVDARSDIWALGVILYELVAGRVPFDAQTMPLLCTMVLQDQPPPLGPRVRDLPRGFEAVVLRCLAKDRNQRFPNVHELARALAEFAPQEAQRSIDRIARIAGSGLPPSGARTLDLGYGGEPPPLASTKHPSRKGWTTGAVVALLIALGAGLWRWATPSAQLAHGVPAAAPVPAAPAPEAPSALTAPAAPATPAASAAPAPASLQAPTAGADGAPATAPLPAAAPARSSHRSKARARRGVAAPAPAQPEPAATPPTAAPPAPAKPNPLDGRL